ncbi:ribonuclease H-like domain-containing protein, partial [Tanacetum coccineum]
TRALFYRRTAHTTVRAQPVMSPSHSARVTEEMALSDSTSIRGSDDENPPPPPPQTPTQQAPHTVSTIKLPILKKDTNGVIKVLPPKTAEEILARERERKARTTLLMALPEDHLAKFHKMTDAKEMWDAIKSRFGGNDESKKMQKYILKQQFELFWHFAKECRSKGNQEIRRRDAGNTIYKAKDNGMRPGKHEEPKALVTLDGDAELQLELEVTSWSKECKESYAKLKKLYDEQMEQLGVASTEIQAYDKTNELTYHKKLLAKAVKEKEELKTKLENFQSSSKGLSKLLNSQMNTRDKSGLGYGNQIHEGILSYEKEVLESVFDSPSSDVEDSHVNDRFVKVKGMHAVPPPMTGIYMPSKSDFGIDESNVETPDSVPKPAVNEPTTVSKSKVWSDAPIIEEYESDNGDEYVIEPLKEQKKPSFDFVNTVKHVKTLRETVKEQNTYSLSPKANKRDWNGLMSKNLGLGYGFTKKACFVCGSFSHLIRDCDFHEKRMAKQVELNKQKGKGIGQWENRPDDPQKPLKNKGIVYSGCSRHMTINKAYLVEYQDYNGGPIAFRGSKGNISSKGKIKTGKLDFEDVFFVKELHHFNLFSVSQMCDKKNKVLFTDTECLVLSPDFKLPDENKVLLRVPRKNNMYSFNLENIVPTGGLACLIAKATIDESNKWHRRLGHVNFKNLNKLVKGNLVRGLPSKIFQNDHTCVACQKGKQHKASCKAKVVSSISQPLQLLHMDLFGPTSLVTAENKANKTAGPKEANHSAGTQDNIDAENFKMEVEPAQEYFVLSLWSSYTSTVKSSKAKNGDEKPNGDTGPKINEEPKDQEDQAFLEELERLKRQEKEANDIAEAFRKEFAQCTEDLLLFKEELLRAYPVLIHFNTVSTPISTASPSNVFSARELDIRRRTIDKTLFIKKDKNDIMLVQVYVDDIIFGSTKRSEAVDMLVEGLPYSNETQKSLTKDEDAADGIMYIFIRSIMNWASLMYLTASRPDIMFAVCTCSRFQVNPKTSHLHAMKMIFSDYARAKSDRKSIIGGLSILAGDLFHGNARYAGTFWLLLLAEPGVMWDHSLGIAYEIEAYPGVEEFTLDDNVADPFSKLIELQMNFSIAALVEGSVLVKNREGKYIYEASIRSSLLLNDAGDTACLTNEAIFQNLALMGRPTSCHSIISGLTIPIALAWNLVGSGGNEGIRIQLSIIVPHSGRVLALETYQGCSGCNDPQIDNLESRSWSRSAKPSWGTKEHVSKQRRKLSNQDLLDAFDDLVLIVARFRKGGSNEEQSLMLLGNIGCKAQIERDAEIALKVQAELDEEARLERQRQEQASLNYIANLYDEVQARIDANHKLAVRWTQKEQEKYLEELYNLVMQRFESTTPKGVDLVLWGDLRTMFDANTEDELWQNQERWNLKSCNFYENCGVHTLILEDGTKIHMLVERKYPLIKETLERMMSLKLIVESASKSAYNLLSKELASPKQMALGKDISNPLIVDGLLKTIWLSMHHVIAMKHWLFQSKRLLMSVKDKSGLGYGDQIHEGVLSYENEVLESVFNSRSSDVEYSLVYDRFVKVEGMHAVPPLMTGIYMPPKFDFGIDESNFTYGPKQSKTSESAANTIVSKPKVWSDAPIIEEYESDSDDEYVNKPSRNGKDLDDPQKALKNKGIVDSGCSRHMTGNKAYFVKYQDYNGGPVAFGGSKGQIIGKGKIRTGKLEFEDVYFVKELKQFNLFSVSQMCDKKNKVLFTDSECLVLSHDFNLHDENQVLLRVPRQNNMYIFNLENIVPTGGLACLIEKATVDESNKWHRRMGHVNFKNLNKLVKGNLVRGLPSKFFPNDHTCVACQKGKQHKASWIKREYSNARTPQQNGVAERKNMTLIEGVSNQASKQDTYELITGTQDNIDAGNSEMEAEPAQEYFVLPLWSSYTLTVKSSEAKNGDEKPNGDTSPKTNKEPKDQEDQAFLEELERLKRQVKEANDAAEAFRNEVCHCTEDSFFSRSAQHANYQQTQSAGIFTNASYDDEGAVTDFTNLETTVNQRRNNHKDFQHCLFSCFLSQIEPNKRSQALKDESWVDAMQEELLQFKIQKVWILVDLPFGKKAIGTKWVYKKEGERCDLVRTSKVWLPRDIDKRKDITMIRLYTPVARLEAIRIFMAFASNMGLIIPKFPKKVYKVSIKALYGFHQAPRAWYLLLSTFFLKMIIPEEDIDKTLFIKKDRNNIMLVEGTSKANPNWAFGILECHHLTWKPILTVIMLEQILIGNPQQEVVNFLAGDLSYGSARNCCGQVLWIQNQMLDYGFNFMNTKIYIDNESTICIVKNPVFHSKTKHIKIRHHFIRDAYEKKLIQVLKIHTDDNVADLLTKAFDVSRFNFLIVNIGMINL